MGDTLLGPWGGPGGASGWYGCSWDGGGRRLALAPGGSGCRWWGERRRGDSRHSVADLGATALLREETIAHHAGEGVTDVFVDAQVHLDLHRGQPFGVGAEQVHDTRTYGRRSPPFTACVGLSRYAVLGARRHRGYGPLGGGPCGGCCGRFCIGYVTVSISNINMWFFWGLSMSLCFRYVSVRISIVIIERLMSLFRIFYISFVAVICSCSRQAKRL